MFNPIHNLVNVSYVTRNKILRLDSKSDVHKTEFKKKMFYL